jgi:hypothetical protein
MEEDKHITGYWMLDPGYEMLDKKKAFSTLATLGTLFTLAPPAIAICEYCTCFLISHIAWGGIRTLNKEALAGRSL